MQNTKWNSFVEHARAHTQIKQLNFKIETSAQIMHIVFYMDLMRCTEHTMTF